MADLRIVSTPITTTPLTTTIATTTTTVVATTNDSVTPPLRMDRTFSKETILCQLSVLRWGL